MELGVWIEAEVGDQSKPTEAGRNELVVTLRGAMRGTRAWCKRDQ